MIGQILGHYRVLEELGAGGMGVVYRARDERLERDVALKLLHAAPRGGDAAITLLREARAAAALNHPHICAVFEVGEADGQIFLAMELVAGQSLERLLTGGPVPSQTVARLGAQVADALAHAHQHGVVHRDLKPANIVVSPDGRAKVLDFGVARTAGTEATGATTAVTSANDAAIAGTLAYLPPEVLRGNPADARGDIWALGVLLFEMATGNRPFQGATPFELTTAILRDPPPPLPPSAPRSLAAVTARCLEKDPGARYQTAAEVRASLETLEHAQGTVAHAAPAAATLASRAGADKRTSRRRTARAAIALAIMVVAGLAALFVLRLLPSRSVLAGPSRIESLAVLPLDNMTGDPGQQYFADGMTEALIAELAEMSGLKKVTSRTSVMQFKQKKLSMPEIAKLLGVDAIIEGSVRRSPAAVGVTVQLIDPLADRHLWAKTYERSLTDILSLQREIARAIAGELQLQLTPRDRRRLATSRPVNPAAHDAYLLGRYESEKRTPESFATGIASLLEATRIDPNYAPAYAALSRLYEERDIWGGLGFGTSVADQRAAAERAVALDPELPDAHWALATVKSDCDWDWPAAEAEYRTTFDLNPNFPEALQTYAFFLQTVGRHDEALAAIRRAVELAPTVVAFVDSEGRILYRARRYAEAIARFQRALEMDPAYPPVFGRLADAYLAVGRPADAIAVLSKAESRTKPPMVASARLAYAYAVAGQRDKALSAVKDIEGRPGVDAELTALYAALGDKDRAFSHLQRGIEKKSFLLFFLRDPKLDPLRGDRRFKETLERLRLPE